MKRLMLFLISAIICHAQMPPAPIVIKHKTFPAVFHASVLLKAKPQFVVPPTPTTFTFYVTTPWYYEVQQSPDLLNWSVTTNLAFVTSFTVSNNGTNMNFRGCWMTNNVQPSITNKKP